MSPRWKMSSNLSLLLLSGFFARAQTSDITYQDLESLNATCKGLDSCQVPRTDEPWKYNCSCDKFCSVFGTCCADSKYKQKDKRKDLRNLYCKSIWSNPKFFFPWIESCNIDLNYDNAIEELCLGRKYELNNPLVSIPVTDPATGITYRNYFCFACNEISGEERLVPWNIAVTAKIEGESSARINEPLEVQSFHNHQKNLRKWAEDNINGTIISVNPFIPKELENILPFCYLYEMESECAYGFKDDDVRDKCLSYMAFTHIETDATIIRLPMVNYKSEASIKFYRNPHCAICNYESIDGMVCVAISEISEYLFRPKPTPYPTNDGMPVDPVTGKTTYGYGQVFVRLFSHYDKPEIKYHIQETEYGTKKAYDRFSKKYRNVYRGRKRKDWEILL